MERNVKVITLCYGRASTYSLNATTTVPNKWNPSRSVRRAERHLDPTIIISLQSNFSAFFISPVESIPYFVFSVMSGPTYESWLDSLSKLGWNSITPTSSNLEPGAHTQLGRKKNRSHQELRNDEIPVMYTCRYIIGWQPTILHARSRERLRSRIPNRSSSLHCRWRDWACGGEGNPAT